MISFQQAREIAEKEIQNYHFKPDLEIIIVETEIIEKPYAWIFPYTSKRWLEGDLNYGIAGNAPLFIDKKDGRVSTFRTGLDIEGMIESYEEKNQIWVLKIPTLTYSDTKKLLALKGHLKLEQKDMMNLKSKNSEIVATGSKAKLERLSSLLGSSNIDSEIVMNS